MAMQAKGRSRVRRRSWPLFLFGALTVSLCTSGYLNPCYQPLGVDLHAIDRSKPRLTPQWSPDGESIVFTYGEPYDPNRHSDFDMGQARWTVTMVGRTYVAAADGSSVRLLSADAGAKETLDFSPDISPDGSHIVSATTRHYDGSRVGLGCGQAHNSEIETVGLDGAERRRLTKHPLGDFSPVWSPNGATIAFARHEGCRGYDDWDSGGGIYSIKPDGSELRLLAKLGSWQTLGGCGGTYVAGPVWSPDGRSLAFVQEGCFLNPTPTGPDDQYIAPPRYVLYRVNADGTGLEPLYATKNSRVDYIGGTPAWSADGEQIAFGTSRCCPYPEETEDPGAVPEKFGDVPEGDVPEGNALLIMHVDGSNLRKIGSPDLETHNTRLEWSQDGATILFSAYKWVSLVNTDGSGTRVRLEGAYASWSPDSSRIAISAVTELGPAKVTEDGLARLEGGEAVLFTVAPDGSDRQVLVRMDRKGALVAENPPPKPWYRFW